MKKPEITENVDHYCNVCRSFAIYGGYKDQDSLIIHSGTDGVAIRVSAINNGYFSLDREAVQSLIKELKHSVSYSQQAQETMAKYWAIKNSVPGVLSEIKRRLGIK